MGVRAPAAAGRSGAFVLAASLLWLGGGPIHAMIDPAFTPVHLVEGARRIVAGRLGEDQREKRWSLAERRVLKGKAAGVLRLSLAPANPRQARDAREFLRANLGAEAVVFQADDGGCLLLGSVWMRLKPAGGDEWRIDVFDDQRMLKTYAGAADKLIEMCRYILDHEDADVPVSVGVTWRGRLRLARLARPVTAMACLDGGTAARARLFVASPAGDRLFAYDSARRRFVDRTEAGGLDTASLAFALLDLDGDGRCDLASWDGSRLNVRVGREDGTFAPLRGLRLPPWPGQCSALAAMSPSHDGAAGLLISADWPHVFTWNAEGGSIAPLPGSRARYASAGPGAPCVAADWDGDGYADVLQLRDKASLLWRGTQGGFAEPTPSAVTSGGSPARWCVGDFDTDGRTDLYVSGSKANELWENAGAGRFRPAIGCAGSLQYRNEPGAADCLATDLNHDGRPDLALLYEKGHFLYHFNRGYRCMAEEGELKLKAKPSDRALSEARGPMRAAAGDFDGDGWLDLAVAFATGEVDCFLNAGPGGPPRAPGLWIQLPPGRTGPVTVSVWQGGPRAFCVGTSLVAGHAPPTWAALRRRGPCTLQWRLPGGRRRTKVIQPQRPAPRAVLDMPASPR